MMQKVTPQTGAVIVTLLVSFALIGATRADACSCGGYPAPREALTMAAAVFEGTVVDKRVVLDEEEGRAFGSPMLEYVIAVSRAWKGVSEPTIFMRRLGLCEGDYRVGQRYLIYALRYRAGGPLQPSACLPDRLAKDAGPAIAELGTPSAVFAEVATSVPASMPLLRKVRVYLLLGSWHYQRWLWDAAPLAERPLHVWITLYVLTSASFAAALCFVRRWKWMARVLVGLIPLLMLAAIVYAAHEALRNDWLNPFVTW